LTKKKSKRAELGHEFFAYVKKHQKKSNQDANEMAEQKMVTLGIKGSSSI
jgi:hypothetical protein